MGRHEDHRSHSRPHSHSRHKGYRRSRSRSKTSHRHHPRHRHDNRQREEDIRLKQDRLVKARILLLEDNEHEEINVPSILPVEETKESKIGLKDDLEVADDSIDPLPSNKPVGDIEADPLDEYMKEIEGEAVPQEGGQHKEDLDDMDWEPASDLEDENYQQQFVAAFKENFTHIDAVPHLAESATKPQVMHQEDDDAAWELLMMEEDDENYQRLVSVM